MNVPVEVPLSWTTPDVSDRFPQVAVVCLPWRHYGGRGQFAGPVVTVRAPADNSRVRELANQPGDGRVLVVDGGGDIQHALLGDLIAAAAVANGWAGFVIHGCVRDVPALADMDLGVAALGSCPRKTDKQGLGEVDVVLQLAGSRIVPGQWVFVDATGVVVLDAHQASAVLAEATGDAV